MNRKRQLKVRIRKAQKNIKSTMTKKVYSIELKLGDWVLVYFPAEETGQKCKLSRLWYGSYQVIHRAKEDLDITVAKVPQYGNIQVHLSRVQRCPLSFPGGHYWYGDKRPGPGHSPKWVKKLLLDGPNSSSRVGNNLSTSDDNNTQSKDDAKEDDVESGEGDEPVSQQPLISSTGKEDRRAEPFTLMERIVAVSTDIH